MINLDNVLRIVLRFESKYWIDTGIEWARVSVFSMGDGVDGCHEPWPLIGNVIVVNAALRGRAVREAVYHEIGHGIWHNYDLVDYAGVFTRRAASITLKQWWSYGSDGSRFAEEGRKPGFVSGYARTTREEDFCETLSCYMVNGGKTEGRLKYARETFNVVNDSKLKKKLQVIPEILEACAEAEEG